MSTKATFGTDFHEFIMGRGPFPVLDIPEVPLPDGFYVCMSCKQVSSYYPRGGICQSCEARGELQGDR